MRALSPDVAEAFARQLAAPVTGLGATWIAPVGIRIQSTGLLAAGTVMAVQGGVREGPGHMPLCTHLPRSRPPDRPPAADGPAEQEGAVEPAADDEDD